MSAFPRSQRALRALGIALLALGCEHDPLAPARAPLTPASRPAASVATGPVLSIDSPEGSYTLDVVDRVLATPDGLAVPVEAEELPELREAFTMIASLDGPVTAIEYASPPPGGCSELDTSGCTPDATSLPAPGGTWSTAASALGLEGAASTTDGTFRVQRTVTYGSSASTLASGAGSGGGFSALLPGGFADASAEGWAPSCSSLFTAVRDFIPAYRAAVRYHQFALGAITARASALLKEQGKVIGETPIGERPSFGKMKALLEKATATWGVAGAIGAYELALANFKVHEAKMGFLVSMYNSHDCANRVTWRDGDGGGGGGGGENAGRYDIGGGILVICIFVDYYSNSGTFLRTEKIGCSMYMT